MLVVALAVAGIGGCRIHVVVRFKRRALQGLRRMWPILLLAVAGCGMYSLVHVEARYVAAFLVMFWCAAVAAVQGWPQRIGRRILTVVTLVVVALLLLPMTLNLDSKYSEFGRSQNTDAIAAAELQSQGIRAGDHVGRISSLVTDLGIERIARVEVVAEVDFGFANGFWTAPTETQRQVLESFTTYGAKAVIATRPQLTDANRPEWERLASSQFWVWLPSRGAH